MDKKYYKNYHLKLITLAGLLLLFAQFCFAATNSNSIVVTDIHTLAQQNQTQVVLNLTSKLNYKLFSLSNPDRVVIDLPEAKLAQSITSISLANTPISHLRAGHPTPGTLRVVLDLIKSQHSSAKFLDTGDNSKQLIITLSDNNIPDSANKSLQQTQQWLQESLPQADENQPKKISVSPPQSETINPSPSPATPVKSIITAPQKTGHRQLVIIIDPGHGGKDPGTSGSLGVREKDVVLAISQDLYEILNNQPGFKPVLTRNRDYFVPLRGRLAIARQHHGDMFIAIHADAYKDTYATGASVFTLSPHGASSEAARWLAAKENYSELGGVSLRDKSDMLRSVLIDLSQTATISSSLQLGTDLIQQLGRVGNLHYRNVEQAPFMVLKSPDIPSVLVETGFLSNPEEQARLHNPVHQRQIAQALATGIERYFYQNAPPGTMITTYQQE